MAAVATAPLPHPITCCAVSDGAAGEVVAAALSDGRLALLASVEDDLWEETLEVSFVWRSLRRGEEGCMCLGCWLGARLGYVFVWVGQLVRVLALLVRQGV